MQREYNENMKKQKKNEYSPGKIKPIIQVVARLVQNNPGMADNMDYLWANIVAAIPELKDRSHCANCGESMAVYIYSVTYIDTKLLCAMAEVITKRMSKGMSFTDANKIHLPTEIKTYTLISRQTISSKLGLIAKVMKKDATGQTVHDRHTGWSITRRGFDFLKGLPIPRQVKVFHNRIQEHFDETIVMKDTLHQATKDEGNVFQSIAGVFVESYEKPTLFSRDLHGEFL